MASTTQQKTSSASKSPSNPSDAAVIRSLTQNITTISVPFTRSGLIAFGGRATLVRLTNGSVAVFSPVALTDAIRSTVADLTGPTNSVEYIVAPDIEHHIFISDWKREYPHAKLIGPEGLPEKRAKSHPEAASFDVVYTAEQKGAGRKVTVDEAFDRDFDVEYVDSHVNRELVFYYKPERVLIEADLMFNLPPTEQYSRVSPSERRNSVFDKLFAALGRTEGDLTWARRFLWYVASKKDRDSFNASIRRIATWDFATVIPCHGESMVGDGKERFTRLFEWHLAGEKTK
ncbi:hypothetical protein jhhlp_004054 [Lomentospora prolificans]|uniref:Metallo-beta-lactamase domain-containing protein n=1 Tax=Lomentospora prolificans TaxID=41688 RepID=A0A2N3NAH6_9PEZI|nr:hypothetical protein jhhlp_004054 [Lomentospora prolificans]